MRALLSHQDNTRTIHLGRPPSAMWSEVIARDREAMRTLFEESANEIRRRLGGVLCDVIKGPFLLLYYAKVRASRGELLGESNALARATGSSKAARRTMATFQRAYSLSHLGGCTAAVVAHPQHGMVHLRCLDWDVARRQIAAATRIFDFRKDGRLVFKAVGIAGMVGVLSGMRPGAFSATLNFAPSKDAVSPWLREEPTLLLRRALETCTTYTAAVDFLSKPKVSAPVYFTVCGVRPREACVIEIAHDSDGWQETHIRRIEDRPWLVQTNHYDPDGRLADENKHSTDADKGPENPAGSDLERSSVERRAFTEQQLAALAGAGGNTPLDELIQLLGKSPTENALTVQQMAFIPGTGEIRAWAGTGG